MVSGTITKADNFVGDMSNLLLIKSRNIACFRAKIIDMDGTHSANGSIFKISDEFIPRTTQVISVSVNVQGIGISSYFATIPGSQSGSSSIGYVTINNSSKGLLGIAAWGCYNLL